MSANVIAAAIGAILVIGGACLIWGIWPRWEGPIEDSIREQEEEP